MVTAAGMIGGNRLLVRWMRSSDPNVDGIVPVIVFAAAAGVADLVVVLLSLSPYICAWKANAFVCRSVSQQ